jgi:hypothetical protein
MSTVILVWRKKNPNAAQAMKGTHAMKNIQTQTIQEETARSV